MGGGRVMGGGLGDGGSVRWVSVVALLVAGSAWSACASGPEGPVISRDLCVSPRSRGLDVREYALGPTRLPPSTSHEMPRSQPSDIRGGRLSGRLIGAGPERSEPLSDPRWERARACLEVVSWVDRVEGGLVVIVDPSGRAHASPRALLPRGVEAGDPLGDSPAGLTPRRCRALVLAYIQALRAVNITNGDTSFSLRL